MMSAYGGTRLPRTPTRINPPLARPAVNTFQPKNPENSMAHKATGPKQSVRHIKAKDA